jgi:hypothetical protein
MLKFFISICAVDKLLTDQRDFIADHHSAGTPQIWFNTMQAEIFSEDLTTRWFV